MNPDEKQLIASLLEEKIINEESQEEWEEAGIVIAVDDAIAKVKGLKKIGLNEEVFFENGSVGLVYDLQEYYISILILKENIHNKVTVNSIVKKKNRIFSCKVGNFSGRVIDALCQPIDGLGDLVVDGIEPVFKEPLPIIDRQTINKPVSTGITMIDSIIPLGRGQRSVIIGDRKIGKTTIGVDSIINQKNFYGTNKELHCIYVAIGQKQQDTKMIVEKLKANNALEYTTIIASNSIENSATVYITPYTATTIAEYMCFTLKKDVFIIYDDLSKHAVSYRTIDLILRRPTGRESYPGGVFFLHARLLERSGAFKSGNSITSFSILETQGGNAESYISTNVISITDGQLFLETDLFHKGIRPAINVGKSVSRIGSAAQEGLLKEESKNLKIGLMRYEEFFAYTKIIQDLDPSIYSILKKGELLISIIKQGAGELRNPSENAIIITLSSTNLLDNVKDIKKTCYNIFNYFKKNHEDLMKKIINCNHKEGTEFRKQIIEIVTTNPQLIV